MSETTDRQFLVKIPVLMPLFRKSLKRLRTPGKSTAFLATSNSIVSSRVNFSSLSSLGSFSKNSKMYSFSGMPNSLRMDLKQTL